MKTLAILAAASLTAAATSQSIQFAATSNAPVALIATTPSQAVTKFVPLAQQTTTTGQMALANSNGVGARATVTWATHMDSDMVKRCTYVIDSQVIPAVGQPTQASTTIPYHEVLIELTATAPRPVDLTYSFGSAASSGTILFEVDMGDTGVFSPAANAVTLSATLSPQPYRIRIRAQSHTPSVSTQPIVLSAGYFNLDVTADNDLTLTKVIQGCGGEAAFGTVFPHNGIGIRSSNLALPFNAPMIAVLGLVAQPVPLPNVSMSPFPCLLYPRPDALIAYAPAPVGSSSTSSGYSLPIPAAVRPFTFFVQAVEVGSIVDLRTSDGYHVNAF